jgi:hypothetical protein
MGGSAVADSAAGHVGGVARCTTNPNPTTTLSRNLAPGLALADVQSPVTSFPPFSSCGHQSLPGPRLVPQRHRSVAIVFQYITGCDSLPCTLALQAVIRAVLGHAPRSSDWRAMQCDGRICKRVFKREMKSKQKRRKRPFAYLSSLPSTSAIRPGPVMASHCNSDSMP